MPEPIIFIAHQKIKKGRTEEYKKYYQEVAEWMEANKPQTAAHIAYVSEDGTEVERCTHLPRWRSDGETYAKPG